MGVHRVTSYSTNAVGYVVGTLLQRKIVCRVISRLEKVVAEEEESENAGY